MNTENSKENEPNKFLYEFNLKNLKVNLKNPNKNMALWH